MKFSDGFWMTREGYQLIPAVQVFSVTAEERSVTVLVAPRDVSRRSGQLDCPLLTIRYYSPQPDVIGVKIEHFAGVQQAGPDFELQRSETHEVTVERGDGVVTLTAGRVSVKVREAGDWSAVFYQDGRRITGSGSKAAAHVSGPDGDVHVKEELDLGVGELIYGLGERFTPFVKNGQTVDIWNRDGGTSSEQAYKNVPFYLSNRGYGVFVNQPELVSFEVASEKVSKVQFSVPGESLEYYVIGGPSGKEVLERYTTLTGKPALPPAWSFGLWLTTSFTTNYDEETVNSFVDGMRERDLPLHVFHFDCFWMKAFHWADFQWDPEVFPDPAGMLKRLKEKGLHICVWINPYIAQQSRLFAEGRERGYLIKRPNGDVWQWDRWQPGQGIVDFTNPEACEWYAGYLRELVDMGVDSFKTDFGERIPTDVIYHDGSDPQRMHNYYTHLYNKVVFDVLEEKLGRGQAVLFARSATAGGQQFPVHWGGDCFASYESMAESLRGGLSLGLSGFGFWSHDIGGFESTSSADVYKRWAAFGLLSSHSRLHGNVSYRVPWAFDEESVDVMRFFTQWKCRLMPYLFGGAVEASQKGLPLMRAMLLEFGDDPTAGYLDRQYMLGDSVLVAPVFNEEGRVSFYLPQGRWTHLFTGETVEGGTWREEEHGYMSLPIYVRPGTLLPVGADASRPDYDYADGVELQLFELADGATAERVVYSTQAAEVLRVSVARSGGSLSVRAEGESAGAWSLLLRGVDSAGAEGAVAERTPLGVRLTPEAGRREWSVRLA
ncbi:alpha-D-xyloside xylohydrolase [Paenibacillus mucilaginosus]|uniref:alpha-xylosidase n=1 Tax=Paenibacillus mucilaginosus TaxID=61624 RepID=UPI003D1E2572